MGVFFFADYVNRVLSLVRRIWHLENSLNDAKVFKELASKHDDRVVVIELISNIPFRLV